MMKESWENWWEKALKVFLWKSPTIEREGVILCIVGGQGGAKCGVEGQEHLLNGIL